MGTESSVWRTSSGGTTRAGINGLRIQRQAGGKNGKQKQLLGISCIRSISEPYFSRIDRKKLPERILPPEGYRGKSRMQRELAVLQNMKDWSEEEYDELRAVYLGMCSRVDDLTGQIDQDFPVSMC